VIDTCLDTMVELLSDIFLNSVFHAQEVERERQVILQEIKMLEDTPDEQVHVLLAQAVWGDHPLGRSVLGRPETVAEFDSATIKAYFGRAYQPERIIVAAAGNLEHEAFGALVSRAFAVVRERNHFPERTVPAMDRVIRFHRKDLEQVHLCLATRGIPVTDPRRYASSVLNVILGGNMSSRLFQEIRERRGLAYAVYSFLALYSDTGMCGVYVGADESKIREVLEIIIREMKQIKDRPVDTAELKNAKAYLKGGLYLGAESTENQMTRLAHNEIHFGCDVPLEEVEGRIEKVTAEDIVALSNDIFQNDAVSLTLLGPVDDDKAREAHDWVFAL
jgi:predicted Zn-dependent peptidase